MPQDDLTKIRELLEIIKHKVDMSDVAQTGQSTTLSLMKDQLSVMNSKMDKLKNDFDLLKKDVSEVKDVQENRILPSVTSIEAKIKAYGDMYKINNSNSKS